MKTNDSSGADKSSRGSLTVVCSEGSRQRFLRGMITHDLVQRGLGFDDAYSVARAIRGRLADRAEVSTAEIRDLIEEEVEGLFGSEALSALAVPASAASELKIVRSGEAQPFSRGLLARSIHAAGIDLDRAYRLVTELEGELRGEEVVSVSSSDLVRRAGTVIERIEGREAARRYRMVRQISRLPVPLVIYIGGASGTGKSTLALELAPLLRIYRINATDTIRQVMRMVFTPAILPALHSSSFEAAAMEGAAEERQGSPRDPEFAQRLVSTFTEQATRVCVGVRAVVERAAAENMSIVVEGVHLHPGMVPFADLEGSVLQIPLVLATLDTEAHRSRFLTRARTGGRRADRYLESFASIRVIHEHILEQAEQHNRPLIDNSGPEPSVIDGLRVVTSFVERRLPTTQLGDTASPRLPTLLLAIDGLPDRPVRALGGRTPLEAAQTPNLDRLAREGQVGLADPVGPGVTADTASGSLALFGQSPLAMKRGPVEALGAGIRLRRGDIALRGNLATLDERGLIIDRRAGRVRGDAARKLAQALDQLRPPGAESSDVKFLVAAATDHRLAIVLRGEGLSSAIRGSDPGDGAAPGPPLVPQPEDPADERAVFAAGQLALFEQAAREVLAGHRINRKRLQKGLPVANAVLTRGAGRVHDLVPLEEAGFPLRLACVAGDRTFYGLAAWLGADIVSTPAMTANLDTDLEAKFSAAAEALEDHDLVVVHLKGADIAAHDRRPDLKAEFLEAVDRELGRLLERMGDRIRVAVGSDHATLSEGGQHSADPLPVLIWGAGIEPDEVTTYDENAAAAGALQRFPLQRLLGRLFQLS